VGEVLQQGHVQDVRHLWPFDAAVSLHGNFLLPSLPCAYSISIAELMSLPIAFICSAKLLRDVTKLRAPDDLESVIPSFFKDLDKVLSLYLCRVSVPLHLPVSVLVPALLS
jgi:hypothetical protein